MSLTTETQCADTDQDYTLADSSFSAVIEAPIETVDIPAWCYSLPDSEYQACSPAHCAAGVTTTPDGRRMSINVEVIGGSIIVEHYVEEIAQPDHLRLGSRSDLFTPGGRTKIDVVWELRVKSINDESCELTNTVHSYAPPELLEFVAEQGLAFDAFRAGRRPHTEAHNRQETPLFAKSLERHALKQV